MDKRNSAMDLAMCEAATPGPYELEAMTMKDLSSGEKLKSTREG
ncbi:hypothetical protein ABE237_27935 [Brevibacillus formosus]|nr:MULTISPECIES: hypothetical protein [Brevibacillus]MED1945675.1 hypothetical protein [Brevibacillus formosus]MED2000692.1 hypothetical protein [Brevibacillus formosus]MED2084462.1 hypothetical protein [Brevibacillus formosus]